MTARQPTPAPNSEKPESINAFTVRPSPAAVVIGGVFRALVLAGLLAVGGVVLVGDSLAGCVLNYALAALLAVVGIRLAVLLVGRFFSRYTLTPDYLIVERGVLSRSRKPIPIHRIQDVATRQSLVERVLGIGDVVVETAGERGAAVLDDLPRCRHYSEVILKAVEGEAQPAQPYGRGSR